MAIDFPNSPVNGSTYTYIGVRYTFTKPGAAIGYWRVTTPGSTGIASAAEIRAGTDPVKYVTPLDLNLSNVLLPSGTRLLFPQTAAPTGWTKITTHNNKALRVVSGSGGGSGGSHAFSTVFGKTATNSHTLVLSQIPQHNHTPSGGGNFQTSASGNYFYTENGPNFPQNRAYGYSSATNNSGGGGGHSHSMDIRVQYVDLIIAEKD
jgi:hypothetical protein